MSRAFFQDSPPSPATHPASKTLGVLLSVASIAAFALVAMYLGVDANWDLKNYHLYNGYAQLTDRIGIDHNAADIQSYLNPTLDLLLTWPLFTNGGPLLMSVVLGGLQGLNFVLATAACLHMLHAINVTPVNDRLILAVLAAFLGMTGAMVLSEIGTTTGDLTTALLVLCAFICCMRGLAIPDDRFDMKFIVAAGLFSGLAAGLKLTNGVFVVSLFGIIALFGGARRLRACLLYGTASFVAIVIVQGWWSWKLWQWFGSPMFPFFNNVFHSPYFPEELWLDRRLFPWSVKQALVYPFFFSWNSQTAETPFRDFRYPAAYLLLILLGLKLLFAPRSSTDRSAGRARRTVMLFATFVVLTYVTWQSAFSIQRYAIALELLLPAFSLVVLLYVWPHRGRLVFIVLAAILMITTKPGNWGRLHWRDGLHQTIANDLRRDLERTLDGSAVVLGSPPLAYLATLVQAPGVMWLGPAFNEADARRASAKLSGKKQVFAITRTKFADVAALNKQLAKLGLPAVTGVGCREFATIFDDRLLLCAVARPGGVARASPRRVYRSNDIGIPGNRGKYPTLDRALDAQTTAHRLRVDVHRVVHAVSPMLKCTAATGRRAFVFPSLPVRFQRGAHAFCDRFVSQCRIMRICGQENIRCRACLGQTRRRIEHRDVKS